MSSITRVASMLVLASVAACSGDDTSGDDSSALTYDCDDDDRDEAFLAGMQKTGPAGVQFTLVSSSPAPPARGDNTWVVQVDRGGTAVTPATLTVTPFMPDHRHGTPIVPEVGPSTIPGRYQVTPVNLWMPGLWEITVQASPTGGGTRDEVVFKFCIAG